MAGMLDRQLAALKVVLKAGSSAGLKVDMLGAMMVVVMAEEWAVVKAAYSAVLSVRMRAVRLVVRWAGLTADCLAVCLEK